MKLKHILLASSMLFAPLALQAREISVATNMKNYSGPGAYVALYVTDANGAYVGSLWMAGGKAKYYKHLSGWYRATGGNTRDINGLTGASVGAGKTLSISLNLDDEFFDQGYQLHVDSSVEERGDAPNEVVIPLTNANSGKAFGGKRFVNSVTVKY